jgi:flavin reductase (DIM6/NTAB) family NADH-FMN oxidoreductase RutF
MAKVKLDPGPYVVPMPLVLVGATVEGKANFMPAAFLGIANYKPTVVACGLSPTHHTCAGIVESKAFSLNIPDASMVAAADWCGLATGATTDKSAVFETFPGEATGAPMISRCRLSAECRLLSTVPFSVDTVYFGEVVGVWADEEVLDGGQPDWPKVDPLIFTFPDKGYWKLGEWVARAWSVGKGYR